MLRESKFYPDRTESLLRHALKWMLPTGKRILISVPLLRLFLRLQATFSRTFSAFHWDTSLCKRAMNPLYSSIAQSTLPCADESFPCPPGTMGRIVWGTKSRASLRSIHRKSKSYSRQLRQWLHRYRRKGHQWRRWLLSMVQHGPFLFWIVLWQLDGQASSQLCSQSQTYRPLPIPKSGKVTLHAYQKTCILQ